MNYLAHGYRFSEDPLFLAGTAVPDWLRVAAPRIRVRPAMVETTLEQNRDKPYRRLCQGILQHHSDDDAFHASIVFQEMCEELSQRFRCLMTDSYDHRPGLLGHIIIEMLLDNELARRDPTLLPQYYRALESVDAAWVQKAVTSIVHRSADRLADFIEIFRRTQFLYDYAENTHFLVRLNQVMERTRLETLDNAVFPVLNHGRQLVAQRADELMQSC